jgi:hypothetical protein
MNPRLIKAGIFVVYAIDVEGRWLILFLLLLFLVLLHLPYIILPVLCASSENMYICNSFSY